MENFNVMHIQFLFIDNTYNELNYLQNVNNLWHIFYAVELKQQGFKIIPVLKF